MLRSRKSISLAITALVVVIGALGGVSLSAQDHQDVETVKLVVPEGKKAVSIAYSDGTVLVLYTDDQFKGSQNDIAVEYDAKTGEIKRVYDFGFDREQSTPFKLLGP